VKQITKIIILKDELSDAQITSALRVGEQTMWWRALIQLIDTERQKCALNAAAKADLNNPLGMAGDAASYATLSGLLIDLENRRSSEG
jgi:hypothetical protein